MKYFLSAIITFSIFIISSCRKDTTILNQDIIGDWLWKSSHSSNGTQMLSNDTSRIYNISFRNDFSFSNTSFCIIGGPTEGTFEIKGSDAGKILILKSQNNRSDSLKISIENNHLILTETFNNYSWFHDFDKK
jgi:hypothetical protein